MVKRLMLLLSFLLILLVSNSAQACTLFGANGQEWVAGGGTMIVKNRDWTPSVQTVKLVKNINGYSYYGLFAPDVKAGINEKGLVVVSASASSIPKAIRLAMDSFKGLNKYLLEKYASVDEALQDMSVFLGPRIIMLADKAKIAYVEVGAMGKRSVTIRQNNIISHTNHYVDEGMEQENYKGYPSSTARYDRINNLLQEQPAPFSLGQFISFSEDRNDGPDNSIWRVGSKEEGTQTIGVFLAYLPEEGPATIYIKMRRNPGEKGQEEIFNLSTADIFGAAN